MKKVTENVSYKINHKRNWKQTVWLFTEKMLNDEAPEIECVQRFKEYLLTYDNGIVIDCVDGTQIALTIQTR